MRIFPQKNSFTRGQFSALLRDRVDEAVAEDGCAELTNMLALPVGGVTRRAGTRFCANARAGTVNLFGFAFNQDESQTYCLEFGDRSVRFFWGETQEIIIDPASLDPTRKYTYGGTGTGFGAVTFSGTYTGTARAVITVYCIAAAPAEFEVWINGEQTHYFTTTGTHSIGNGLSLVVDTSLDSAVDDYWLTEVYWPLQLVTPWDADMVGDLRFCQKEDALIIVHKDTVPRLLKRYGHDQWELEVANWAGAPWENRTGLRYKIYDVISVYDQYVKAALTKSHMDYMFSEENGAVLFDTGHWDDQIAFSIRDKYYPKTDKFSAVPSSFASIEIWGNLFIPEDGNYFFALNSGHMNSDLFIDGNLIDSNYGASSTPTSPTAPSFQTAMTTKAGSADLKAGVHRFRVRAWFTVTNVDSMLAVLWKRPGTANFVNIPAQYFSEETKLERYGVSSSVFKYYDLTDVVLPSPMDQAGFDSLFSEATAGVVMTKTGRWEDRMWFHSQALMTENPFVADAPPTYLQDNSQFSLEIGGWLTIEEAGTWGFALDTNDGAELLIWKDAIGTPDVSVAWLSNIGLASGTEGFTQAGLAAHSTTASLSAGVYQYRVRFWNAGYGFGLGIAWMPPGTSEYVPIPRSAISPSPGYYPSVIAAHQQRLVLAGFGQLPLDAYVSETFDWENFETGAEADDPFRFQIAANDVNRILWMVSKEDALLVGTAPREYRVMGRDGVFAGGEILVRANTTHGSVFVDPVEGEDNVYFADRSGINLREYSYVFERDKSVGVPIDLLCGDLLKNGIKKLVFQSGNNAAFSFGFGGLFYPHRLNIVWVLTEMGELFALVREVSEKVYAWSRFETEGTVESIAVTPGTDGDHLWMVVNRTLGGVEKKFVEVLDPTQLFDCGQVFDGAVGTSFADLGIAAVQALMIRDDGSWVQFIHATYGEWIPLGEDGSWQFAHPSQAGWIWHAGLPFELAVETLRFDQAIAQGQTTLGKPKTWVEIVLQVANSLSTQVALADEPTHPDTVTRSTLYTGEDRFFVQGWSRNGALRVELDKPYPLTLKSIGGEMMVNV